MDRTFQRPFDSDSCRRAAVRGLVLAITLIVALLAAPGPAGAAINKQVNFQGRITDSSGIAVPDGSYNLEFKLHNDAAVSGGVQGACSGSCLWMETRTTTNKVVVSRGLFSVQLGSVASLASFDFDQDPLFLSIRVGGTSDTPVWDGEMTPRHRLGAAPQAVHAANSSLLGGQAGSFYTNASNLISGTVADARLSTNVALRNVNNSFSTGQTVTGTVAATDFTCSDCINAADLAAGSVGAAELTDGSVALADLASNSVDGSKIADGSVALADVSAAVWPSVHGSGIALPVASAANNGHLFLDTDDNGGTMYRSNGTAWVKAGRGATETSTAGDVVCTGCVDSSDILDGTIAAVDIAAGAVGTSQIADGSVASIDVAADTIVAADIAAGAVGASEIADGSVDSIDIAADTIIAADIAASAVGTSEIADGSVALADVGASVWPSVHGSGITLPVASAANDGHLFLDTDDNGGTMYRSNGTAWVKAGRGATEGATATDVVCTGCVHSSDILDGTIAAVDIAANAVTTSEITDGSVASIDIAADTIIAADIAAGAVGTSEITDGSIAYTDFTEQPNSRVHRNSAQTISNATWEGIVFETANDTFSMWNGSGRITIPAGMSGLYFISGQTRFAGASGGVRRMEVSVNGAAGATCESADHGVGTTYVALNCSDITLLGAGDYLQLRVTQNSGGALTASDAHLRVYRLPS